MCYFCFLRHVIIMMKCLGIWKYAFNNDEQPHCIRWLRELTNHKVTYIISMASFIEAIFFPLLIGIAFFLEGKRLSWLLGLFVLIFCKNRNSHTLYCFVHAKWKSSTTFMVKILADVGF